MLGLEVFLHQGIARSIGRARIETSRARHATRTPQVSPDQLVGRGLKRMADLTTLQGWLVSPDQLVGRGLKRRGAGRMRPRCAVSPDQLVGRGLKQVSGKDSDDAKEYRPINWSGAD